MQKISDLGRYRLGALKDTFGFPEEVSHDALDDAYDLRDLVRAAKPEGKSRRWNRDFLMSAFKDVSHFL